MKTPFLLAILLLFWLPLPTAAQEPLSLNTFVGPPLSTPEQTGYYDQILREAFGRMGIPVTIRHLPAERSLQNANKGIDDGDFVRIFGMEKRYPNLVVIPEKIDDFEFVAFTRTLKLPTTSWASLTPYQVGIVRGWKILEDNLSKSKGLTLVKDQLQLFTLLKNDRADAVVYARHEGYQMLEQLGMSDAIALEPPLAVRPMYLYLNKKHAGLVEPLTAVLRKMKEDGTFATIARKNLPHYLPQERRDAHP